MSFKLCFLQVVDCPNVAAGLVKCTKQIMHPGPLTPPLIDRQRQCNSDQAFLIHPFPQFAAASARCKKSKLTPNDTHSCHSCICHFSDPSRLPVGKLSCSANASTASCPIHSSTFFSPQIWLRHKLQFYRDKILMKLQLQLQYYRGISWLRKSQHIIHID